MTFAPLSDAELGPLTDDRITRDYRVWQRAKGHRFSVDDVATAFVAHEQMPNARRVVELGTGLGSVLLMLAWRMPEARFDAIEAQAVSYALLLKNIERNGLATRCTPHFGDLREITATLARAGATGAMRADLVTGTPPYFPEGAALPALDEQRTRARIETRGGVEAYLTAAAALLAPEGRCVLCADARAEPRVLAAANALSLRVRVTHHVFPKAGKPPLFRVWTLAPHHESNAPRSVAPSTKTEDEDEAREVTWTLRSAEGATTADANRLRQFCGFEPLAQVAPR